MFFSIWIPAEHAFVVDVFVVALRTGNAFPKESVARDARDRCGGHRDVDRGLRVRYQKLLRMGSILT